MDFEAALHLAQDRGASYADVRVETTTEQKLQIQDGELRELIDGSETGFGLRVLVDGAWGFSSSNDLSARALRDAVESAIAIASATKTDHPAVMQDAPGTKARVHWRPQVDPRDVDVSEKRSLLASMDETARAFPEVKRVTTSYSDTLLHKEFLSTDGAQIEWSLTRSVAQIHFTARRDGQLAGRSTRVGGTRGWELFSLEDPIAKVEEAAKNAVGQLGARQAKGGKQTVVIDPELAGVFAHEAVGHASEADLVATGESCFRGRMGERLGIEGLHIRDDSTLPGAFGSIPFDDNGIPGQDKVILQDGVLRGFLSDRERAAELGIIANGAARAQDFHSRPLVRMSNTIIDAGDQTEEEVLGIKDGIFCQGSRGGQVDTARGTFLFHAQDAWRIQDGEKVEPLRDVSLTGEILGTLHNIDALGDQQRLGDPGYCGKGQWIPVCDGGPLVRIQDCLVGGGQ